MSVPAEKLDMLFKDLLEQANKSSEEFNVISLDEYKKQNQNKIVLLSLLKKFVSDFNKNYSKLSIKALALIEEIYFMCVYFESQQNINSEKQIIFFKTYLDSFQAANLNINYILNEVKNYPNKKLKTTSLKIDDKVYKIFKYFKNRIDKIQEEMEEYNFSPPPYMESAIENIEHIEKKVIEYKDKPRAILSLFNIYYSDPEDLEWTDEDREYVRKHYASKER